MRCLAGAAVRKRNGYRMEDHFVYKLEKTYSLRGTLMDSYRMNHAGVVVVREGLRRARDAVESAGSPGIMRAPVRMM